MKLTDELLADLGFTRKYGDWWSGDLPGDARILRYDTDCNGEACYYLSGREISTVGDIFEHIFESGIEEGRKRAGDEFRKLMGLRGDDR